MIYVYDYIRIRIYVYVDDIRKLLSFDDIRKAFQILQIGIYLKYLEILS